MKERMSLRPLNAALNDCYSTAELYATFENQVFKNSKLMDVSLLRETVQALDDRDDEQVAPHFALVWQKIQHHIEESQHSLMFGLPRKRFVLLVAVLLLLISSVAFAVANWNSIIERIYHLEHQESRVDAWSLSQKEEIVYALMETDYDTSSLPDLNALSDNEKNAALTQWLKTQFDGEVNSYHYNLMIKLNGFFDGWSLADKAWYYQMLIDVGNVDEGDFISTIPMQEQEIDTIQTLANQMLHEAYDNTDLDTATLIPYLFYGYVYPDESVHYWRVHYRDTANANWFTVQFKDTESIDREGEIVLRAPTPAELTAILEENSLRNEERQTVQEQLETERGLLITWSYEQQAEMYPVFYGIPDSSTISQEDAYEIARRKYCEQTGSSEQEANSLFCYSYFMIDEERPYYAITFFLDREATKSTGFYIEIYGDGEIRNLFGTNNG